MAEKSDARTAIIVSSTPPRYKNKNRVVSASSKEVEDDSPIRHIPCVKNKDDVKQFEEVYDCFILDFDPFEPIQLSKLSVADDNAPEFEDDSPIRHIPCVKNKDDAKQFEEVYDCFILDFDPFEPIQSKLSVADDNARESPDVAVVAGKVQIQKCCWNPKISVSSTLPRDKMTNRVLSASKEVEDDSLIRHILCVKNKDDVKKFEEVCDCFILDFDPYEPIQLSKLSIADDNASESPDVTVVAEKGQIACRDYPHSRHLCLKFPFATTPHQSYCDQCYCYVCDSVAPCGLWKTAHCHAAEHIADWKSERELKKLQDLRFAVNGRSEI